MAEVITLAGVRLDSRGVVEGVDKSNQALKKGEAGVNKFAAQTKASDGAAASFVRSLFDLRGALVSVAGALGLTFILGAVAIGLKNLVSRVLENNEAWNTFKEQVSDTFRQMILGETVIDRIQRKLEVISAATGIETVFSEEKVKELVKGRDQILTLIDETQRRLQGEKFIPSFDFGLQAFKEWVGFSERRVPPTMAALQGSSVLLQEQLRLVNLELSQMLEDFIKMGGTVEQFEARYGIVPDRIPAAAQKRLADLAEPAGPELPDPFTALGIPKQSELEQAFVVAVDLKNRLDKELFTGTEIGADRMEIALNRIVAGLQSLGATREEIEKLGFSVAGFAEDLPKKFDTAAASAEIFGKAMTMATQAAIQALFEGGVNAKKALANILKTIAAEAIVRGVFEIAEGFRAAANPLTAANAPLHFTAAKFFFKTAALAAVGALAIGGRGGGGAGGGAGGGGAAFGGERQPERAGANVTVIIQGSQIGTDKDQLARDLAELIDTAREDGS